jgi:hypothetical protein
MPGLAHDVLDTYIFSKKVFHFIPLPKSTLPCHLQKMQGFHEIAVGGCHFLPQKFQIINVPPGVIR